MVDDFHRPVLLHPQFSHDDIVDSAVDVRPRISLVPLWQLHSHEALWLDFHRFAPKLELRVDGAVECEARRVRVES